MDAMTIPREETDMDPEIFKKAIKRAEEALEDERISGKWHSCAMKQIPRYKELVNKADITWDQIRETLDEMVMARYDAGVVRECLTYELGFAAGYKAAMEEMKQRR
jgi:hypothetical protein